MRSTFFGLETGKRALQTHQREQDTIGHNVSNASTPGYSRQRAGTASTTPLYPSDLTRLYSPGQIGTGVTITDVIRIRDVFIDTQVRRTNHGTGNDDVMATTLRQIESVFNEPGDEGISTALNNFFNSWHELTKQPENIAVRTALREVSNTLVDTIQQVNYNIRQIQIDADTQMKQKVNNVNRISFEIADLNQKIVKAVNHNDNPNDLYDKRDVLVDDLSKLLEVQVLNTEQGQIAVLTGSGTTLVRNDHQFKLFTEAQSTNQTIAATRNEKTAIFSKIVSEDNLNAVKPVSGELGGHIQVRDVVVPEVLDRLDEFVETLITGVNSVHSRGFGLDGTTRLNFFADDKVVIPLTGVLSPTWRHTNTGTEQFPQNPPITTNTLLSSQGISGFNTLTINKTKLVNSATTTETINIAIGDPTTTTIRDVLSALESQANVEAFFDVEAGRIVIRGDALQQQIIEFGPIGDVTPPGDIVAAFGGVPGTGVPVNLVGLALLDYPGLPLTAANISLSTGGLPASVELKQGTDYTLNVATGDIALTASGTTLLASNGNTLYVRQSPPANTTFNLFAMVPPVVPLNPATNAIVPESVTFRAGHIPNDVTLVDGRDFTLNVNTGDVTLTAAGVAILNQNGNALYMRQTQLSGGGQKDFFTAAGLMQSVTTLTSHDSDAASRLRVADEIQSDVNKIAAAPSFANLPGDNVIAVEIARLQNDLKLSGVKDQSLSVKHTSTYTTFFNSTIAELGLDSQAAQKSLANNTLILQEFLNRREEISGVNLDEELTHMIEVQKSYNAAARFVTVTDEMLETIILRMGIVGR